MTLYQALGRRLASMRTAASVAAAVAVLLSSAAGWSPAAAQAVAGKPAQTDAQSKGAKNDTVTLNFKDADIDSVIGAFGHLLDRVDHVGGGRRYRRGSRDQDDLAHRVDQARGRDDLVSCLGVEGELPEEVDDLLVVDVVRSDQDAEGGREPGLVLEEPDVLHDLAVLVDPLDRIGLDLGAALHEHAADEQDGRQDHQWQPELGRQATELHHNKIDQRRRPLLCALGAGLYIKNVPHE
jgi:hypothetical protein